MPRCSLRLPLTLTLSLSLTLTLALTLTLTLTLLAQLRAHALPPHATCAALQAASLAP